MNLLNMAKRGDNNLELVAKHIVRNSVISNLLKPGLCNTFPLSDKLVFSRRMVNGLAYRGWDLDASQDVYIKLKTPLVFYPFNEFKKFTGWQVMALDSTMVERDFLLELIEVNTGDVIESSSLSMQRHLQPVMFPYPKGRIDSPEAYDLKISVRPGETGRAFLAVHKILDRCEVIKQCTGRGVEIGPGLNPQILPDAKTEVTYLEQSKPQDWDTLYNMGRKKIDPRLWKNYQLGEADNIPFPDESLDFIFSSHVFEHLANPIGYLESWRRKLKNDGRVVAIIPDVAGSKDYVHRPCNLDSMKREYEAGDMKPALHHYERWAKYRAPGESAEKYFKMGRSIHVHFYTNENMVELLSYAVDKLNYSSFSIQHTPNHKDFYFVLNAG